jgi:hypothetical protein
VQVAVLKLDRRLSHCERQRHLRQGGRLWALWLSSVTDGAALGQPRVLLWQTERRHTSRVPGIPGTAGSVPGHSPRCLLAPGPCHSPTLRSPAGVSRRSSPTLPEPSTELKLTRYSWSAGSPSTGSFSLRCDLSHLCHARTREGLYGPRHTPTWTQARSGVRGDTECPPNRDSEPSPSTLYSCRAASLNVCDRL